MVPIRFSVPILMLSISLLGASAAFGQNYPSKPIRILVAEPGSSGDVAARIIAQGISGPLGQPVIIDNRPPSLIAETGAKAAPDGYTILVNGSTTWITPLLRKTSYDPVKDFSPITSLVIYPNILVLHPLLPVKSVKELIALAKAHPGELNYAQGPLAGGVHLSGALFKYMAGVNVLFVPYSGASQGVTATIAGETQFIIWSTVGLAPHIKSGKLRALAVTTAEPTALAPGLPTVASSGLPGYESVSLIGMAAPAGTSATIINRLNQEIVRFLTQPDVKERFSNGGAEVVSDTPEHFANKIKSEVTLWSKVIKDAGIKVE